MKGVANMQIKNKFVESVKKAVETEMKHSAALLAAFCFNRAVRKH